MIDRGDAPIRTPHAIVPHGQMRGDTGHSVVPEGDATGDSDLPPPDIARLRKMFDESRDLTDKAREEQQKDQDYYDGPAQVNSEVRHILKMRGQPTIIDNRIAPAVDGILGVMEAGKTDPRAYPRNPQDQQSAEVATKTLRYIADRSRWQASKMDCAEDYLKQGLTAAIVEWDGRDISVSQIRWETFFYDPKSRRPDFSDGKYRGVAKWMYTDEVKAHPDYGPRATELGDLSMADTNAIEDTWDDRPSDQMKWVDKRANRVLIVEIYYQHAGEWLRCVYCAAGWLEYGRSPYLNPITGETRCPIEAQSFKVDRQNQRYGPIRNMRPMQDEVNARRSRGLHLLNSRQVQLGDSMIPVDADTVRTEAARADGVLPNGATIVSTNDMASGNLQLLSEAKDSLSRMVPVALAQDLREGGAASGRARQVAQQAGLTQFGRGFGRFEDFEERIYRQMWMSAQQFWTAPMYIRVTDNPRAPEFLQINEPAFDDAGQPELATDARGLPQVQPLMGPDGQPVVDPVTGQPAMQPVQKVNNRIASMDMDVLIASTPDTIALEQEVFEAVMNLVQSGVDPLSPVFQIMLELAPLPDKTRLLERIEAVKEEASQGRVAQLTQLVEQLKAQLAEKQSLDGAKAEQVTAQTAKTIAETERTEAQTLIDTQNHIAPNDSLADEPEG